MLLGLDICCLSFRLKSSAMSLLIFCPLDKLGCCSWDQDIKVFEKVRGGLLLLFLLIPMDGCTDVQTDTVPIIGNGTCITHGTHWRSDQGYLMDGRCHVG